MVNMDDRFIGLSIAPNLTSLDGMDALSNVSWDEFPTKTTLCLKSNGTPSLHDSNSKGVKRKWGDTGETLCSRHTALALALEYSSTSSVCRETVCTMPTAKQNDFNFQLHIGRGVTAPSGTDLDLQLSLSVGPSLSGLTSLSAASDQHLHNRLEPSVSLIRGPAVSSASSWGKGTHLLPYVSKPDFSPTKPTKPRTPVACIFDVDTQQMQYDRSTENFEFPGCVQANPVQMPVLSSTTNTATDRSRTAYNSGVCTQRKQRNSSTKNCGFPGCVKGARGASGLCIAHGGGKRCKRDGCQKGAEGKTIYCKAHGGGRRCEQLGCTKSAEGRTDFCIAHGGGRRCNHEGCSKAARGRSGLCIKHGGGKRCLRENCTKSAEGISGLCIAHGGGRRCLYPACQKGAQGSTMLCKAHGGGKRCTYRDCNKGAEGSTPFCKGHGGGKRCTFLGGCSKSVHGGTQFCVAHGGGKRCAAPDCKKSARGRTKFCVRHGGGKRCKSEGCPSSAQGSTDFCKAHGGGNRCLWGQPGSAFGAGGPLCGRLARGKIGLCASHSALVQDNRVHGESLVQPETATRGPALLKPEKLKGAAIDEDVFLERKKKYWEFSKFTPQSEFNLLPVPEGRVHGGNLMALFASSSAGLADRSETQVEGNSSHQVGVSFSGITRRWV